MDKQIKEYFLRMLDTEDLSIYEGEISLYIEKLYKEFKELSINVQSKNLFEIIEKILGIDSKLQIIRECYFLAKKESGLTDSEFINLVEKDYVNINQENAYYGVTESLIFQVT